MTRIEREAWIVLITEGTVTLYPPEIYLDEREAEGEAERWAWILAEGRRDLIESPFEGRWEVADKSVRRIRVAKATQRPWIGTFWSVDGTPDPEAIVLGGKEEAREWVMAPLAGGQVPIELDERPWVISATFVERGEESYAVATKAKQVLGPSPDGRDVEYLVEITGTFVQAIRTVIVGPAGLTRPEIEDRIEQEWSRISIDTDELLESSWDLISFRSE